MAEARSWKDKRTAACPVCGEPNPPRRLTCSATCKKAAKAAYDRARYAADPATTITRAVEWQREHRARKQAYDADYRERTRDRRLALKRTNGRERYHADIHAARERARLAQSARRARRRGNGVFLVTERDLRRALARARGCCARCEEPFTDDNPLEWDHVVPIRRGGAHSIGNLWPTCRRCNRGKGRRLLIEWVAGKVIHLRAA